MKKHEENIKAGKKMNTINVKAGYKKEKVLLENLSSLIKLSKIAKNVFRIRL
jgi:hypothetical protein